MSHTAAEQLVRRRLQPRRGGADPLLDRGLSTERGV
jgi:hypothetical protein